MVEPCQCVFAEYPGLCRRHGRRKSRLLHELCQRRADYRKLWDEETAKVSTGEVNAGVRRRQQTGQGVGSELTDILRRIGFPHSGGCRCAMRAREMDANGIQWCEENIDTIVGWLSEGADSHTLSRWLLRGASLLGLETCTLRHLVRMAIDRAKQRENNLLSKLQEAVHTSGG